MLFIILLYILFYSVSFGVYGYELHDEPDRPEFIGTLRLNPTTNTYEKYYETWKRIGKLIISIPLLILFIGGFVMLMLYIFT
jgi:hypothetical protein